jgi:hypothetical protein
MQGFFMRLNSAALVLLLAFVFFVSVVFVVLHFSLEYKEQEKM